MNQTLANTKIGEKVKVVGLKENDFQSKLLEMGFYDKKEIEVLFVAPFNGPIAVKVGSYILSLRLQEAASIFVQAN